MRPMLGFVCPVLTLLPARIISMCECVCVCMCVLCACASTHFGLCRDVLLFSGLVRAHCSATQMTQIPRHIVQSVPLVLGYPYMFRARVWIWPPLCSVNVVVFVVAVPLVLNGYLNHGKIDVADSRATGDKICQTCHLV